MTRPKILLDPDDFDALHLSALANGGIGRGASFSDGAPCCVRGHGQDLDEWTPWGPEVAIGPNTEMTARLEKAGLHLSANDNDLAQAGIAMFEKIPFERYITILNIDIKESK